MKRFLLGFVLALFAACGDDESGFAPRDEDSSSSVCEDCDDSSSSVKSSSSKKETSSSSCMELGDGGSEAAMTSSSKQSSSSKKVESSSSSLRLSSVNLSSSSKKDGGSESAMTESSSSEYVPFDHSQDLAHNMNYEKSDYKTFVDPRNGRSYYYYTATSDLTGKTITVMAENLNIGEMILGENDQNDDSKIERYCYNNDTTRCDIFGGLYQWAEMMQLPSRCNTESCSDLIQPNHQGICPDGWRLFTWDDYVVIRQYKDDFDWGIAGLRSQSFSGYNTSGFSLIGGGFRSFESEFSKLNEYAYWFFPTEDGKKVANVGLILNSINDGVYREDCGSKRHGLSVRCTKLE